MAWTDQSAPHQNRSPLWWLSYEYEEAANSTTSIASLEHLVNSKLSSDDHDPRHVHMAAPFGFSAGDFIAVTLLIKDIIQALQFSAVAEHRELCLELQGLKGALHEIENLAGAPGQEPQIIAVKEVAKTCERQLAEFAGKLKKFEVLEERPGTRGERLRHAVKRVQWGLLAKEDVQSLRTYLVAHVGSLNVHLNLIGINSVNIVAKDDALQSARLETLATSTDNKVHQLSSDVQGISSLTKDLASGITVIRDAVINGIIPQLERMVAYAFQIWTTNQAILAALTNNINAPAEIDISHTFFQKPYRLEIASGYILPLPPELGWSALHAIIRDRYKSSPTIYKILANEYELFDTADRTKALSEDNFALFPPGSGLTMSVIIGSYGGWDRKRCLRYGCPSRDFAAYPGGGWRCCECDAWLGKTQKSISRPFRALQFDLLKDLVPKVYIPATRDAKPTDLEMRWEILRHNRIERKWMKNMSYLATDEFEIDLLMTPLTKLEANTVAAGPTSSADKSDDALRKSIKAKILEDVFQLSAEEEIPDGATLVDCGLDSLMALELQWALRDEYGIDMSVIAHKGLTMGALVDKLVDSCQ